MKYGIQEREVSCTTGYLRISDDQDKLNTNVLTNIRNCRQLREIKFIHINKTLYY